MYFEADIRFIGSRETKYGEGKPRYDSFVLKSSGAEDLLSLISLRMKIIIWIRLHLLKNFSKLNANGSTTLDKTLGTIPVFTICIVDQQLLNSVSCHVES